MAAAWLLEKSSTRLSSLSENPPPYPRSRQRQGDVYDIKKDTDLSVNVQQHQVHIVACEKCGANASAKERVGDTVVGKTKT